MKAAVYLLGLAGAALFTFLLAREGITDIALALAAAGWGIAAVAAFHVLPMLGDAIAWWKLFEKKQRPRLRTLLWMRWIGESINNLLPAAQVGGDIVRARLAMWSGVAAPPAVGTVVVELTVAVFTQVIFTLLGIALLVGLTDSAGAVAPILAGVLVATVLFLMFYVVQRIGIFRLLRALVFRIAATGKWQALLHNGDSLDQEIQRIYRRRRDVAAACVWTLVSWIVGAGEIWIALYALGVPVSFAEALVLESMAQAVRGALFVVPGALGFQEGGFIVVGAWLGIPAEPALALSLIKRGRDLLLGLPGLLMWQTLEGKRLVRSWFAPAKESACT